MATAADLQTGLAYDTEGSGTPVVFLHGLTIDRRTWWPGIDQAGRAAGMDRCQGGEHPGPCLAVFGRPATDGERERLARLPDAQIEEWTGDGHFVHLVDPGRFATRLRTFVRHCDLAG